MKEVLVMAKEISPWAEFAEERRASARKYNDRRNQLRLAFRSVQQEAYRSWCAWEEEMEEEEGKERVDPPRF